MIDRIKFYIKDVDYDYINDRIKLGIEGVAKDESYHYKCMLKNIRFAYKVRTLYVEGSIHKYAKGNNYCRYTFSEAVETLQGLSTLLGIPLSAFNITSLEIGVNIPMDEAPMKYIELLSYHKGNPFLLMHPRTRTTTIYGSKCSMSEYRIKFYDKIADYIIDERIKTEDREKLPNNILRYEIQFSKKQLQTFGFKNPTAESLCSRKYATFCANLLYSVLEQVIFNDTSIEFTKIAHKSPKALHNMVKEYIFVTSNGYDRYLGYLSEYVGEDEYKKAKRHKANLLKKYRPLILGKYEKELREKFTDEMSKIHDYKRATRKKV